MTGLEYGILYHISHFSVEEMCMKEYSQKEIEDLIRCKKEIIEAPRKDMKLDRGSKRNGMKLKSSDDKLLFRVFIRQNADFPEDFSIGLEYLPIDERDNLMLLRCNGPHGEFEGALVPLPAHFQHHIHKAKEENIQRKVKPEKGATQTSEYASFEEALSYFLKLINVQNAEKHFANLHQLRLALDYGDTQ